MHNENQDQQSPTNQQPVLLTPPEVARILGIGVNALAKWRCGNLQPLLSYIKVGRMVRYHADAVKRYLDARTISGVVAA